VLNCGLVEQVHHGLVRAGGLEQERRPQAAKTPQLVRLVVVQCQPAALVGTHAVDVLARHAHPARARLVAAGDQLEQGGLAGTVGAHDADHPRSVDAQIGLQLERGAATRPAAAVALDQPLHLQQRLVHAFS
jgi:hypothetical protein